MKSISLAAVVAVLLVAIPVHGDTCTRSASCDIEQTVQTSSLTSNLEFYRQEFVAQTSGNLCQVQFRCSAFQNLPGCPVPSLDVSFQRKNPDNSFTTLFSVSSIACLGVDQLTTVPVPGAPIAITAGTSYALQYIVNQPVFCNAGGSVRFLGTDQGVQDCPSTSVVAFGAGSNICTPANPCSVLPYVLRFLVTVVTPPVIHGDPHFVGFHGQTFDFTGKVNHFYNLLSSKCLQMNAKFVSHIRNAKKPQTILGELGVQFAGHKVRVSANGQMWIDNEEVAADSKKLGLNWVSWRTGSGYAALDITKDLAQKYYGPRGPTHTISHVASFEFPLFDMEVMAVQSKRWKNARPFLDISFTVKDDEALHKENMHGIIGQTARWNNKSHKPKFAELVGEEESYKVKDLWGTRFAYNQFYHKAQCNKRISASVASF